MRPPDYDFSQPRKQSATGIVVMFINTSQRIVRSLAIPLLVVIFKSRTEHLPYILAGAAVLLLIIAVFAYFQYQTFTYYLNEELGEFVVNEGVFVKTNLVIQLDKIQQVNINQSLLQRLIGVYTLQIDTAGSDKKEGSIRAIDKDAADALKRKLLNRDGGLMGHKGVINNPSEEVQSAAPFLRLSPLTLLKIGATSNYGQTIALVVAFFVAGFQGLKDLNQIFKVNEAEFEQALHQGITLVSICISALVIIIGLLVLNIIRTYIKYADFEVFKQNDSLRINSGMLAKKNTFLNAHRVQLSSYTQNLFQKKMNLFDLKMKQNSPAIQSDAQTKNSDVEIPGCSQDEKDKILKMIFDTVPVNGMQLLPDYRFLYMGVAGWIVAPVVIFLLINAWLFPIGSYSPWMAVYAATAALALYCGYKNHRLYVSKDHIIKKQGIWDIEHQIIVPHKIQAITIRQMLWHRRANIGHITCHTAAGNISFRFGNYKTLQQLMNYWLYQIESSGKDWM